MSLISLYAPSLYQLPINCIYSVINCARVNVTLISQKITNIVIEYYKSLGITDIAAHRLLLALPRVIGRRILPTDDVVKFYIAHNMKILFRDIVSTIVVNTMSSKLNQFNTLYELAHNEALKRSRENGINTSIYDRAYTHYLVTKLLSHPCYKFSAQEVTNNESNDGNSTNNISNDISNDTNDISNDLYQFRIFSKNMTEWRKKMIFDIYINRGKFVITVYNIFQSMLGNNVRIKLYNYQNFGKDFYRADEFEAYNNLLGNEKSNDVPRYVWQFDIYFRTTNSANWFYRNK